MTKRTWIYIGIALVLVGAVIALRTVFNKPWWIRRAAARWGYKTETVDGAVWYTMTTTPFQSFREDYLLSQPMRRLREFYDTGTLKEPGATGGNIEQDVTQ
jgi:hypothetical protein